MFGVSFALGAFFAGMILSESQLSARAAEESLPLRDAFAVLFFVSIGMLFNPMVLVNDTAALAASVAIVVIGNSAIAYGVTRFIGYSVESALLIAVGLAQIGEFSFILAMLGKELGLLTDTAMHTVVATAIISITLNPLLYRLIDPMEAWVAHRPRLWGWLTTRAYTLPPHNAALIYDRTPAASPHHRAVVVGYGPVGQTVTRLLQDNDIEPTIIELNRDNVRCLREAGVSAIYGDASHRDILQGAGVGSAGSLILSAAGMHASAEMIRLARELNPTIRILARVAYVRESPALHQAGAEYVFSGEGEVALAMTEAILRSLGATPEQIDRERERVHTDLFDGATVATRHDAPHG
jgi:CPA2 family monovalent cation:H+ antiporter-2